MKSILTDYEEHSTTYRADRHDQTPAHQLPNSLMFLLQTRTAEAIFVVDPDYRIVYWEARAESLTGLLSEETIGKPCQEVLGGECEGEAESTFSNEQHYSVTRPAQAGQVAPGYEMKIPTRWGQKRWVGVSNLSVETQEGTYLIHLLRDTQAQHETLEMARGIIGGFSVGKDVHTDTYNTDTHRDVYRDTPELTPRQLEVLGMLASGKSAREICTELYLSQATVRNHIRALLVALGAHSQLEALAKARQAGLLVAG
jgi:PAS domain S-box-containing protein